MGKPTEVRFIFDYLSPYAYFASLRLPELCARCGVTLSFQPVVFAALLDHWGHRGPAEIPPKALHTFKDCVRHALRHRIPFRSPRFHPFVPLTALRASLREIAAADQARVVRALFDLGWGQGGDLGNAGEIASALDAAGLDGAALVARAREPEAKEVLRRETQAAVAQGVFGIPTMLVGSELFWGHDQLENLELHLQGRDPLDGVELEEIASRGRAATRPGSLPRE